MSVVAVRAEQLPSGESIPVLGEGIWHLAWAAAFPPPPAPVPLDVR